MNLKNTFFSLLVVLLMSSCVNLDKIFNNDYKVVSLNIPASIESIEFYDKREIVSSGDIALPVISMPNQFIAHYPAFEASHKITLTDLLYKNFKSGENKSFIIIIELLEGVKEFSTTFWNETERVKVKLRITLKNDGEVYFSETEGEYFVSSADAKYKRFEELYQRALLNVTFNGLVDIRNKHFKNTTMQFHE